MTHFKEHEEPQIMSISHIHVLLLSSAISFIVSHELSFWFWFLSSVLCWLDVLHSTYAKHCSLVGRSNNIPNAFLPFLLLFYSATLIGTSSLCRHSQIQLQLPTDEARRIYFGHEALLRLLPEDGTALGTWRGGFWGWSWTGELFIMLWLYEMKIKIPAICSRLLYFSFLL